MIQKVAKMMEALSFESPPTDEEVESILFTDVQKMLKDHHVDDDLLRQTIHDLYVRFGGRPALGSMSGWLMHTRSMLGRNIYDKIIVNTRDTSYETGTSIYSASM
jgi:hypothetical protein